MKIAILGAGAMGSLFGAHLAEGGQDVTLVDVYQPTVDAINADGLTLEDKAGNARTVHIRAETRPESVGIVDLILVFVKCYHTETAIRSAQPMIGVETGVLTLQNGWGNAPRIAEIIGEARVLTGVTYHSATVLKPGVVQHAGRGMTFVGELNGAMTMRLEAITDAFRSAGIEVTPSENVLQEVWKKLALNVCTLPTSALLRFYAGQLIEHEGTLNVMRGVLRETVAVAQAQGIPLEESERWGAITGLLERATGAKASMLQDVENRRRTEIDVVNGAVVAAGERVGVPTPLNQAMVWLVKSLEETFGN